MEDAQLKKVHLGSIAAAVVLLLVGLVALGGSAEGRLLVILVLVALLGVQLGLWWQDRRAAPASQGHGWAEPAAAPAEPEPARMVIKCKQCGEVFPVIDTGARPLVAACPHCGKSGTIKVKTDAAR